MYASLNPYNQVLVRRFDSIDEVIIEEKCQTAQKSFDHWSTLNVKERIEKILALASLIEVKKDGLAALISTEMGKPFSQSKAEVEKSILLCRHYAEISDKVLKPKAVPLPDKAKASLRKEALGAILGIMPWNFPVWQSFRFAIPAILSGNVILLKPASNTPQCGLKIEELFTEAGMENVLQCLLVDTNQIEKVIANPIVQGVSLTGSDKAGSVISALAGKYIKKSILELGGNDAYIVLADADIAKAAKLAVKSRFNNNGQTCNAAKRWIIDEAIAEKFMAVAQKEIAKLKQGDPFDPKSDISCLARIDIAETLQKQVDDSVQKGATVLLEGGRSDKGSSFAPMVLGNVKPGMPAYHEELFGPVAILLKFSTIEDALRLANDTVYGLCASLWTADKKLVTDIATKLHVGYVAINNMVVSDPRLPFGGVKRSGFGRELGDEGLLEFVNLKTVLGA